MWMIAKTPQNYTPSDNKRWCIIDSMDGDIHDFYETYLLAYIDLFKIIFQK